jgi:hypothetical protein
MTVDMKVPVIVRSSLSRHKSTSSPSSFHEFFMKEIVPKGKHVVFASFDIRRVCRLLALVVSMK